jgi:hypothetical protein
MNSSCFQQHTQQQHTHSQTSYAHQPVSSPCASSPPPQLPAQAKRAEHSKQPSRSNLTTVALLRLYWPILLLHSFWVIVEIGIRCAARVWHVQLALTCVRWHTGQQHSSAMPVADAHTHTQAC